MHGRRSTKSYSVKERSKIQTDQKNRKTLPRKEAVLFRCHHNDLNLKWFKIKLKEEKERRKKRVVIKESKKKNLMEKNEASTDVKKIKKNVQ